MSSLATQDVLENGNRTEDLLEGAPASLSPESGGSASRDAASLAGASSAPASSNGASSNGASSDGASSDGASSTEASLEGVIRVDEAQVRAHLDEVVRRTVEETLNGLLEVEADQLCGAARYTRSPERLDTRAGHYTRQLLTKAGQVALRVPRLRSLPFETQIIERYRRRESSVEEALMEMYLAGVSVRRVEDITQALWGERISPSAVSELNQKIYATIEAWRNRPLESEYAYVYLDGIWLKRSWGGEVNNVAVLVAIGVRSDGHREILGVVEGMKEDADSWRSFLRHLKARGLRGVRLVISDKCLGLLEALGECFPEAKWQRCVVHFYRNVFTSVPRGRRKEVAAMLKAIHSQEDRAAAREKGAAVADKLDAMKLSQAATTVRTGVDETLSYMDFPREHWTRLRTNNVLERIMREIRRRTRVVGAFPDGHSAVMLVAARLRHIAGTKWGSRPYLDMERLRGLEQTAQPAAAT
jgi:putative transposase